MLLDIAQQYKRQSLAKKSSKLKYTRETEELSSLFSHVVQKRGEGRLNYLLKVIKNVCSRAGNEFRYPKGW